MAGLRGVGEAGRVGSELGIRAAAAHEQVRRPARSGPLAAGTLACARCDAPVLVGPGRRRLTDPLGCPFCGHRAPAREFLTLAAPIRPARVTVRFGLPGPIAW